MHYFPASHGKYQKLPYHKCGKFSWHGRTSRADKASTPKAGVAGQAGLVPQTHPTIV